MMFEVCPLILNHVLRAYTRSYGAYPLMPYTTEMGYINLEQELRTKWDEILEYLKVNFEITDVSFRTFIKKLSVYSVAGNNLLVLIDDVGLGNVKDFIIKKYNLYLQVSIEEFTGVHFEIEYLSKMELESSPKEGPVSSILDTAPSISNRQGINAKYTFDTFVVGDNNDYAHAASLKVAEEPGGTYNPLFIYGGAGLGKTHLMHAIANYILDQDASKKVVYVTSETFINEIVDAIRDRKDDGFNGMQDFRNKYRNIDVLLIDDIQFIIGKDTMQSEFFNTFNHLYESQKQIIISSDKHPATMKTLEERLRSRFQMGLTVDIKPPTYETRLAILRKHIQNEVLTNVDPQTMDKVLDYIATNISSNIRELQGAITKVIAFSKLRHRDITMELAVEALSDMISPNKKREITLDFIIETVADHFNITVNDILSSRRSNDVTYPRHICMYLCRKMTNGTQQEIASKLKRKDHTTVLNGYKNISDALAEPDKNPELVKVIDILEKKINP